MGVTSIEKLLATLDKVKLVKPGHWTSCCPAHHDRNPSLSIRETQKGIVLIKCWAGCDLPRIVASVGLEERDLFPTRVGKPRKPGPSREAINYELLVIAFGKAQLARGKGLTSKDQARFDLATARLERLMKP
ncbi:virulence-associated protein E [Pseudomonas sp. NPDC087804]|uniref:virulence-associated protein E n=1 Tax=Pseudomonas sp. NPDC087804 TaxID=3364449 RepID=UPI003809BEB9